MAIDPETAESKSKASTQEGGLRWIPANQTHPVELIHGLVHSRKLGDDGMGVILVAVSNGEELCCGRRMVTATVRK